MHTKNMDLVMRFFFFFFLTVAFQSPSVMPQSCNAGDALQSPPVMPQSCDAGLHVSAHINCQSPPVMPQSCDAGLHVSAHINCQSPPVMPQSCDAGLHVSAHINCQSWRLGVEANNIRDWKKVPKECVYHVADYMTTGQYHKDCDAVGRAAVEYAKSLKVGPNDIWVFDIDETALSNLEYYADPDVQYGATERSSLKKKFNEWIKKENATALPAVLALYNELIRLNIKVVFLTALPDTYQEERKRNLEAVGYKKWEELILRKQTDVGMTFKSKKREDLTKRGYTIVGNMGDQWSDLVGSTPGNRTFKLPNPMYYT